MESTSGLRRFGQYNSCTACVQSECQVRRGEQVYFACFASSILQCGKHYDLLVGAESSHKVIRG